MVQSRGKRIVSVRLGSLSAVIFCLFLTAVFGQDRRAIPLNLVDKYAAGSPLASVVSTVAKPPPDSFECRLGIYRNELIVEGATSGVVSGKEVPSPYLNSDSFALTLDTAHNLTSFHVINLDFSGKVKVFLVFADGSTRELPVKTAATVEKRDSRTVVTGRILLDELQILPSQGDVWGVEYRRFRLDEAGKPTAYTSGDVAGRRYGGAGRGQAWIVTPRHFQEMIVGSEASAMCLTRGNLAPEEILAENRFSLTFAQPPASGAGRFTVSCQKDLESPAEVIKSVEFPFTAEGPVYVNQSYPCPADAGRLTFTVTDARDNVYYRSTYPILGNSPASRPPKPGRFTEAEVEKAVDLRLQGISQMVWPGVLFHEWMKETNAVPVAYEYDYDDWLKYYKANHTAVILVHPGQFGRDEFAIHAPAFRKHGLACVLMPLAVKARDAAPHRRDHAFFLPDPAVKQAYFVAMTEALKEYPDVIKYVFIGDEIVEQMTELGVWLYNEKRDTYPFILKVNEDVKQRFGFGRYGIPTSTEGEKLSWLAWHRWVADFFEIFSREVIVAARALKPDILFMSPDCAWGSRAKYFETWKGLFDITSHQEFWAWQNIFDCKVLKDLTGAHVWPCPHLESMATVYSPGELTDILSACFMAGADGLHIWAVPGRDAMVRPSQVDSPGATDMWRQYGELMARGFRARHTPQVAVLYSNDTYCAGSWPAPVAGSAMTAYEGLGPDLGVDFKLVGDLGLERGHDQLSDFRVMIVPEATIERRAVGEKILKAVENGLWLFVHDPKAFSTDLDGTNTNDLAARFLGGAKLSPAPDTVPRKPNAIWMKESDLYGDLKAMKYGDLALTYVRDPMTFTDLPANAQVVMTYPAKQGTADSAAAAISVPVGKGMVVWFGGHAPIYGPDYAKFYRPVFRKMGIPDDQPGWRVKLPLEFRRAPVDGVFLTGNYYGLEFQVPQIGRNVFLPGTYRYSLPPDKNRDVQKDVIPFSEGYLTDRPRSTRRGVTYSRPESFQVDFDLAGSFPIKRADLYLADYVPEVSLLTSFDGKEYHPAARHPDGGEISGVRRCSLSAGARPARYLRFVFQARPERKNLTIAEVDIIALP